MVRTSRRVCSLRVLLLAATALSASPASAVDPSAVRWVYPGSGNWLDPANWDHGSIPTSDETPYVDNGGAAQVTGGDDAVSNHVIIGTGGGSGAVEVSGSGSTLTVLNNIYLGVYGLGTLDISGGGVVSVGDTAFVGQNYDSAMGGTGLVTVTGPGSVLNTVSLAVGFGGKGTIEVTDGGTLSAAWSNVGFLPDGDGKVVVDGAGSSWSTGDLTVGREGKGAIEMTDGGVVSSTAALIGKVAGSSGSVLVDGVGSSWTIAHTLTIGDQGSGSLIIANGAAVSADAVTIGDAGALVIGAAPEDEPVAAGTLVTDSIDLASATARLVFNHTDADYTFDADIDGVGVIELLGPGRTLLTGSSRDFYGEISLLDGELMVDGWLGGDMTSKGRLSGIGIVRNVSVIGGGVIAPGHDGIGTLAMEGNLYMGPGSTYEVEIDSGSSDLIQVLGIAYVDGADIAIKRGTGPIALGAGYIILSAEDGFYGSFGEVISDYAFVTPELQLGSDGFSDLLTLEFNRNDVTFVDVAKTANQASAAAAVEALGRNNAAHNTVLSLNEAEAQAMFDSLSGEGHATLKGVLMDNAGLVSDALLQRLDAARALDASGAASGYAAVPTLPEEGGSNAIWGQFYGGLGKRGSDGNAAEADQASGGLLLGADAAVGDWQIGLSAQVGQTAVSIADRATTATTADLGAGFYAGMNWGDTAFSIAGTVTRHTISTTREVGLGLDETLIADYGATTGQVVAELEHEVDFGTASLIPYAQLGHTIQATDAFTETGNGAGAALSGEADVVSQSFATLGVRGAYQFVVGQGGLATFSGGIGWRRGFGEAPTAQLGFLGGSPFVIAATPAAADALQLEAGIDFDLAEGLDLSVNYTGEADAGGQSHVLRAGVGGRF